MKTSGGNSKKIGLVQQLKIGLSLGHFDGLALKFDDLSLTDFASFPELNGAVDFDLPFGNKVLGHPPAFCQLRGLHEITEGDELTALEFKFFHDLIISESILIRPVDL